MIFGYAKGDTLVVTKLDRFARSVSQASGLLHELIEEGVTINVLNLGILSNDSANTLMRNVLLCFAQFERDMIVERTQEGKAVAKESDPEYREGRPPKFDKNQLDHAMSLLENHSCMQVVKQVKRMRSFRAFHTIKLDSLLNHNQIYAEPEDFDFVLEYISKRISGNSQD